jgi:hypothetical protein
VCDREADSTGDDRVTPSAFLVEHLDGKDACGRRDAGDAESVPGARGDDPGDVRAVSVVVLRDGK